MNEIKVSGRIFFRESTDEWVLEISAYNAEHWSSVIVRHTAPKEVSIENVISLEHLYPDDVQYKFYRIKHKPTGLFFVPSRDVISKLDNPKYVKRCSRHVKSNLSTKGKIYHHKPQLTLDISSHVPIQGKYLTDDNNRFSTKESDWEIVGYE